MDDDLLRKLTDLAVAAGEKRFSAQTEYIHLKYDCQSDEVQYPIPTLENLLFALALFRTRTIENVMRAKLHLEKILCFQNGEGHFPMYLHEYPECKDHYLSLKLIPAIYWILKHFTQVLGHDLKLKVEKALACLMTYSLKLLNERNPPFFIHFRIAASAVAVGKLLHLDDFLAEGRRLFGKFLQVDLTCLEPKYLADLMISLQMIDLHDELQRSLLRQIFSPWHQGLNTYLGLLSSQEGFEPQVTLYDLFMGYFSKGLSKRVLQDTPLHLYAALIQPLESILQPVFSKHESYIYCQHLRKFKFFCGGKEHLHTLSLEGGNIQNLLVLKKDGQFEFIFNLGDIPELEDKEMSREILFYFDHIEKSIFTVDGVRANTFQINEELKLESPGLQFTLKFEVIHGAGQFLGHFMRGNRPSQIATKGKNRFIAFDNQVFLRTIRRDPHCQIRATMTLRARKEITSQPET